MENILEMTGQDLFKNNKGSTLLWILFHTLAQKIKDSFNETNIINLIEKVIIPICVNHPCPICRKDSFEYIDKNNFRIIKDKRELKYKLWEFHNYVNNKLNRELFDYENLDNLYEKYEIFNIIKKIQDLNEFIPIDESTDKFKVIIENAKYWTDLNIVLFEP